MQNKTLLFSTLMECLVLFLPQRKRVCVVDDPWRRVARAVLWEGQLDYVEDNIPNLGSSHQENPSRIAAVLG